MNTGCSTGRLASDEAKSDENNVSGPPDLERIPSSSFAAAVPQEPASVTVTETETEALVEKGHGVSGLPPGGKRSVGEDGAPSAAPSPSSSAE